MKHMCTQVTLKNGLKGLVLQAPDTPVVSIELSFRAGEFLLTRDKWETAHLMEHLMLGANASFKTARAFQAELEKNGAYSNASTSAYDVTYEIECARFEAERVIGMLVDALQAPVFKKSEFKAEFGNVKEELVGRSNNHFRTLNLSLREALGLYCVSDTDRVALMKNVTAKDVYDHYKATHSIQNARFIVAGDITQDMLKVLEGLHFETEQTRISMPAETPKKLTAPIIIKKPNVPNYYFYIDCYASGLLNVKQRDALAVASTILTETLHSKLLGAARSTGLVYSMGSGQQHLKDVSSFWLGAQVSKQNADALFDLTTKVLVQIKKFGVTAKELSAAKQYMLGKHERSAQTVSGTVSRYSSDYFHDDTIVADDKFQERLSSVTNQDIINAFNDVFCGDAWALAMLGNIPIAHANKLYKKLLPIFAK